MYFLVHVDFHGTAVLLTKVTVKGFKKCCVSNAVSGTDNRMLWKGSEEDGNVRSECEKSEGTDCEDGAGDTDW